MRRTKVDPSLIPTLINEGLSDEQIADRMGWTVGTLRVRCSQLKISLVRRKIAVPEAVLDHLQRHATLMGISTCALAAELLGVIARDGLYAAVLDRDEASPSRYKVPMH